MIARPGDGLNATPSSRRRVDVAPTVLTLGVPVARDMEGKVLVNAFDAMPTSSSIVGGRDHPDCAVGVVAADDPEVATEAMRQLVELGYLAPQGEDVLRDIAPARAEQRSTSRPR